MRRQPHREAGSLWLCVWERPYRAEVVSGPDQERAAGAKGRPSARDLVVRECERLGLGRPDRVMLQGYGASPPSKVVARKRREWAWASGKVRTLEALHLYAALRVDWPLPSRQAPEETRRPSSQLLLDFVANMGRAVASLDGEDGSRDRAALVASVVEAQSAGWLAAAIELNAERAARAYRVAEERAERIGDRERLEEIRGRRVELDEQAQAAARRRELMQHQAKRLKKQKAWRDAIGQLDEILAGEVEGLGTVREEFAAWLVSVGWSSDDAERAAAAWSRVYVPRM